MVEIPDRESEYLNGKMAYTNELRFLMIVGEGQIVDTKDNKNNDIQRIELPVEFERLENKKTIRKLWRPNKPAEDILKKLFGKNSINWVNKKLKIVLEAYLDTYIIKIDELETKALNQPPQQATL